MGLGVGVSGTLRWESPDPPHKGFWSAGWLVTSHTPPHAQTWPGDSQPSETRVDLLLGGWTLQGPRGGVVTSPAFGSGLGQVGHIGLLGKFYSKTQER